jgi:hypothetical protein
VLFFLIYKYKHTNTDDDWSGLLKLFFPWDTILGELVTIDLTAVLKYLLLKLASRETVAVLPHAGTSSSKWSFCPLSQAK